MSDILKQSLTAIMNTLHLLLTLTKAVVLATAGMVLVIPLFSQSTSYIHSIRKLLAYLVHDVTSIMICTACTFLMAADRLTHFVEIPDLLINHWDLFPKQPFGKAEVVHQSF